MLGWLSPSLLHFYLPPGNLVEKPAFLCRSRRGGAVGLEPGFSQHGGVHLDTCASEVAERSLTRWRGRRGLKPSHGVLLELSIFPRNLMAPYKLKCPAIWEDLVRGALLTTAHTSCRAPPPSPPQMGCPCLKGCLAAEAEATDSRTGGGGGECWG